MTTKTFGRYGYEDLRAAATAPSAEQIDIDTLGAWFEMYGMSEWNGEYYDADGLRLYPVYDETDEVNLSVIRYEFR